MASKLNKFLNAVLTLLSRKEEPPPPAQQKLLLAVRTLPGQQMQNTAYHLSHQSTAVVSSHFIHDLPCDYLGTSWNNIVTTWPGVSMRRRKRGSGMHSVLRLYSQLSAHSTLVWNMWGGKNIVTSIIDLFVCVNHYECTQNHFNDNDFKDFFLET